MFYSRLARTSSSSKRQTGIGLIEVLLAVLVIGLGVVGLVKLQGTVFREGGTAKTHAIAAQLARGKLDDLRNFSQLAAGAAGVYGYDEIGNNAGGAENTDGSLQLPTGNVVVSNTTYNLTWTATAAYYCGAVGAAPSATNCTPAKPRPDFYAVKVTVSWTEQNGSATGATNTEILDDSVSATDPLSGALSLLTGASSTAPVVGYRPGQAPQVLAIDISASQKKETTNPTPTLNKQGNAIINTIASYETIRYSATDNTITREQFITLNCSCTQQAAGTAYNLFGQQVNKRRGVPSDNYQASQCTVCCRDHHDDSTCDTSTSSGKNKCYDPYRPTTDYHSSGDHNHYNANGSPANNTGDTYREACRLKRVDGYLTVAQDWHMVALNVIPQNFFAPNNTPDTTAITNYGTYVKDYIKSLITGSAAPAKIWPVIATVNKNSNYQLNARGIYLDYLDSSKITTLSARLSSNDATVYQDIPFYEVNLTKLAQWNSDNNPVATVRNDQLVTETSGQNLYTRGLVTGVSAGTANVTASTYASNTGVINEFITTDPDDGAIVISDFSAITVPGASFTVSDTISPVVPVNVTFVVTNSGGPCTYSTSTGAYSCTVPTGWSGSITPIASGYTFGPASYTLSNVTSSQTSGHSFTSSVVAANIAISGAVSPAISGVTFSGTGSGGSSGTNATCTYTSASGAYSCSVPSGWTGSVKPTVSGYSFAPVTYSYANVTSNQTGQNFTATVVATSFTLGGTVTPALATVTFTASTGASCTYTSGSGAYSCTVPSGWTGSITPSSSGYSFTPISRSYSNVSLSQTGQDFASAAVSTTFTISGSIAPTIASVTVSGTGSGGSGNVTCTISGGGSGYSCIVPSGWNGSVAASASGVLFTPSSYSYTSLSGNQTGQNFAGSFTVSGVVTPIITGVTFTATNGASCGAYNATTGAYSCTVPNLWTGSVTPSATGYTFSPSSRSYTNVTSSYITDNYSDSLNSSTTFTITITASGLSKVTSTTITATAGATCDSNAGTSHTCTVTITTGSTWSGTITLTPNVSTGSQTFTPNDAALTKKGSKSYSAISTNQTQNFSCSGGGC
jgi:Tfp pilus assembly protein PilV